MPGWERRQTHRPILCVRKTGSSDLPDGTQLVSDTTQMETSAL